MGGWTGYQNKPSAFPKDDKFVENNPNKRNPEDGARVNPSTINKEITLPKREVKLPTAEAKLPTKSVAEPNRRAARKLRKAKKLRERADVLRSKEASDKRVARLEKRAVNKEKRAGWKEKQAANIIADKPKKANLTDDRTTMQALRGGKNKVYDSTGTSKGAKKVPVKPKAKTVAPKKEMSFGEAFKAARAANKAKFTWKGKSYHTRRADESKADWQKKFNTTNPSPGKEPSPMKNYKKGYYGIK